LRDIKKIEMPKSKFSQQQKHQHASTARALAHPPKSNQHRSQALQPIKQSGKARLSPLCRPAHPRTSHSPTPGQKPRRRDAESEREHPRRSRRLISRKNKMKVSLLLDWMASQPFDISEDQIGEIFDHNGIAMSPSNSAFDGIEAPPRLVLSPAEESEYRQLFQSIVMPASLL
jgi:hypothetical protein